MSRSLETRISRLEGGKVDTRLKAIQKMTDDELRAAIDEKTLEIQEEYRLTGKVRIPPSTGPSVPNGDELIRQFILKAGVPLSAVIWE